MNSLFVPENEEQLIKLMSPNQPDELRKKVREVLIELFEEEIKNIDNQKRLSVTSIDDPRVSSIVSDIPNLIVGDEFFINTFNRAFNICRENWNNEKMSTLKAQFSTLQRYSELLDETIEEGN